MMFGIIGQLKKAAHIPFVAKHHSSMLRELLSMSG